MSVNPYIASISAAAARLHHELSRACFSESFIGRWQHLRALRYSKLLHNEAKRLFSDELLICEDQLATVLERVLWEFYTTFGRGFYTQYDSDHKRRHRFRRSWRAWQGAGLELMERMMGQGTRHIESTVAAELKATAEESSHELYTDLLVSADRYYNAPPPFDSISRDLAGKHMQPLWNAFESAFSHDALVKEMVDLDKIVEDLVKEYQENELKNKLLPAVYEKGCEAIQEKMVHWGIIDSELTMTRDIVLDMAKVWNTKRSGVTIDLTRDDEIVDVDVTWCRVDLGIIDLTV